MKVIRPRLRAMVDGVLSVKAGDALSFSVNPSAIHVFDAETGYAL